MPNDKDEFFYFSIMDFASIVEDHGDAAFSELEKIRPDIYDKLTAYFANKQIEEFLANQEEVL